MLTNELCAPSGLILVSDFIGEREERELLAWIDEQPWAGDGIP
jgi:hypothetical protein